MRIRHLIIWDMKLQLKYGFYLMYGVFTILYVFILYALPLSWRSYASAILILSDPAAMGLFFMGAIVLLEKSQKVPCSIAVSPIKALDYIFAKVMSLMVLALLVALILALASNVDVMHIPSILLGTVLSNVIFTLIGMIIATKIQSLNQFILWTIPIELICFTPAIYHLFGKSPLILNYYPVNIGMDLIAGKGINVIGFFILSVFIMILMFIAQSCVTKVWNTAGGIKL